jgi:hypothetical protein
VPPPRNESAAAVTMGHFSSGKKNALLAGNRSGHTNPLKRTGGAAALVLRARLNPEGNPRISCARDVLSLSFRARIGTFRSAAATKCVSRRDDGLTRNAISQ